MRISYWSSHVCASDFDYALYSRGARAKLEAFVASPVPTRPIPCADCSLCRWADHCDAVFTSQDSLFQVANITRGQVKKLEASGIETMAALARHDGPVRGVRSEEHTSELQSLMRISYAVFCLKKKTQHRTRNTQNNDL